MSAVQITLSVKGRIEELRLRFVNNLPGRISAIDELLSPAHDLGGNRLSTLTRALHSLAGTAGTYRFHVVAALAAEGESLSMSMNDPIDRETHRSLRSIVKSLRAAAERLGAVFGDGPTSSQDRDPCIEEDRKFRLLSEAAFDGILVHDFHQVLEVNRSCMEMFGYTQDEMIGMPLGTLVDPELFPQALANARAGISRQVTRGVRKDGTRFDADLSATRVGDGPQRIVAIRDISSEKAFETKLRKSERRYRDLLESSHDLICHHDLDGIVIEANPAAARQLGIPLGVVRGMNIQDLLTPEARERFPEYIETIRQNGVASGLMELRTIDGEKRIWHYQNTLVETDLDRPFVRGLARDVTDRENALQALRRSENHFRSIIENVSDMIAVLDPQGRITYHSPATERVLGYEMEEIDGRDFSELIHEDDRANASELFRMQMAEPKEVRMLDLRLRHHDGSWRWFSLIASSMVTSGVTRSVIVNGRDVTDRRLLEAQLEQANRLTSLGRLTATVAHEFNNVLMGMQPFADLMQRPAIPPEIIAKGARHIANSILRGKRVALDMLRFTRPAQPEMKPLLLAAWWDRFVPELQATTEDNIDFTWSFPDGLTIIADESQLSQVFANLVSNARDAMPHGGTLRVSARRPHPGQAFPFGVVPRPEEHAHLTVEDSGAGIPEQIIKHVFDPLFTTKQSGGTGLGLAVAHQVVTRHEGSIFVESREGVGTKFHLFLPLAGDPEAVRSREQQDV